MGMAEAVRICFRKYVTWEGRATRPEFWWFYLLAVLVVLVGVVVDLLVGTYPLFYALTALLFFLPTLSAAVRRLHDTDKSGWAYWIAFVPLVGGIILVVWLASKGTYGGNKYGNDSRLAGGSEPSQV